MEWRPRIVTACIWSIPLLAADIGYIMQHGVDVAAVGFTALAVLPAWAFLDRNVDVRLPGGGGLTITDQEVKKAREELVESAPKAVAHVEEELPQIQEHAKARAALPSMSISGTAAGTQAKQTGSGVGEVMPPALLQDVPELYLGLNLRGAGLAKRLYYAQAYRQGVPLSRLLSELERTGVLEEGFAASLREFVSFGNRAAHGAIVDEAAADEALKSEKLVLGTLEQLIGRLRRLKNLEPDAERAGSPPDPWEN